MPIQYKQSGKTAGICCVVVLTALVARAADDGWPADWLIPPVMMAPVA